MDITHYFLEQGQGEPLLLLHGNGESCEYFKGQIDAFAKQYHVYAIDTRGHEKTPRGRSPSPYGSLRRICWDSWTSTGSRKRICWDSRTAGISRWSLQSATRK